MFVVAYLSLSLILSRSGWLGTVSVGSNLRMSVFLAVVVIEQRQEVVLRNVDMRVSDRAD